MPKASAGDDRLVIVLCLPEPSAALFLALFVEAGKMIVLFGAYP